MYPFVNTKMTDPKLVLYEALIRTVTQMRTENKFNHYQYKFNPLLFRGSENQEDMYPFTEVQELGGNGANNMQENTSISADKHGNPTDIARNFHIAYPVYHRGVYHNTVNEKPYKRGITQFKLRIKSGVSELSVTGGIWATPIQPMEFPVEDYLSDGMTIDDIVRKFVYEFMEVPPCALKQHRMPDGHIVMEFHKLTNAEFEQIYQAIEQFYDNEWERKKVLIHRFKNFPSEFLREYLLRETQDGHAVTPHLHLLDNH